MKHFQSYWDRNNLCRPSLTHTHTHKSRGRRGRDKVKRGVGVMESLGSVWEVKVMNYLHSPLVNLCAVKYHLITTIGLFH